MAVTITITTAGSSISDPLGVYTSPDNIAWTLDANVAKATLLAGYTFTPPVGTLYYQVRDLGTCESILSLNCTTTSSTTTTTTTTEAPRAMLILVGPEGLSIDAITINGDPLTFIPSPVNSTTTTGIAYPTTIPLATVVITASGSVPVAPAEFLIEASGDPNQTLPYIGPGDYTFNNVNILTTLDITWISLITIP